MKRRKENICLALGILILLFLTASYFIKIDLDSGANYNLETRLLAVLIFYNLFFLALYILIAVSLILIGLRKIRLV